MMKEKVVYVAGQKIEAEGFLLPMTEDHTEKFYGKHFKSMYDISMAMMHARCAEEACFNHSLKMEYYEQCFENCLNKCSE